MHKHIKNTIRRDDIFPLLVTDFPKLFNPISPKPLSFSIKEQLDKYYEGELKPEHIHYFLGQWTHKIRYYKAVLAWDYRFDLDGQMFKIEDRHKVDALKHIQQLLAPPK